MLRPSSAWSRVHPGPLARSDHSRSCPRSKRWPQARPGRGGCEDDGGTEGPGWKGPRASQSRGARGARAGLWSLALFFSCVCPRQAKTRGSTSVCATTRHCSPPGRSSVRKGGLPKVLQAGPPQSPQETQARSRPTPQAVLGLRVQIQQGRLQWRRRVDLGKGGPGGHADSPALLGVPGATRRKCTHIWRGVGVGVRPRCPQPVGCPEPPALPWPCSSARQSPACLDCVT